MFQVSLCGDRGPTMPWTAHIEGCPYSGVGAIDFRRAAGLPAAPSNRIELPSFAWTDEQFVRAYPKRADSSANIEGRYAGEQYRGTQRYHIGTSAGQGYHPYLTPAVIAAYLAAQTPETGRAVLIDIWDGTRRYDEQQRAQAERAAAEKAEREAARTAARDLIRDELDALTRRAERAEKDLASLQRAYADLSARVEESDDDD